MSGAGALLPVRDRLLARFRELASERSRRPGLCPESYNSELAWTRYEIEQMTTMVNAERGALGKPPVTEKAIRAAELQACGHADYGSKWALYCAEIVLRGEPS